MTLYEKVNKDLLDRILTSDKLDSDIRNQLIKYRNKIQNEEIKVNYYNSRIKRGRLYAQNSLSLQNFKKEIRHALAKDLYLDIDMENAHPNFIVQYCISRNIKCSYLKFYVKNREKVLKKVMSKHKITREQTKKLFLRLCYLGKYKIVEDEETDEGYEPKDKYYWVENFAKEMKEIAKRVCNIEKDIYSLMEKNEDIREYKNIKASTLSVLCQDIENKCLMEMYNFFKKNGHTVGTLCFDGMMVESTPEIKRNIYQILEECETRVYNKTNYNIKLTVKPMDIPLPFELPDFSKYVKDETDCRNKLFEIEGKNKFIYCNEQLYIFDYRTGFYTTDRGVFNHYLEKNEKYFNRIVSINKETGEEKIENFGTCQTLRDKVWKVSHTSLDVNDNTWLERTEKSSIGYLLFLDGIYNMNTGEFKKGYDPDIVFHKSIPHKFPERNEKNMKYANKLAFENPLGDKENQLRMKVAIATALAGRTDLKKWYFVPGESNAGKTYMAFMLKKSFGGFVGTFESESIAYKSGFDTRDPAQLNRWSYLARFCRILISSEIKMGREIDGNIIKKQAGAAEDLVGRVHCGNEVSYKPHYTCFAMFNDIPPIRPFDDGLENRVSYIKFPFIFVNKEKLGEKPNYKLKDMQIEKKISTKKFIDGFIHIILDAYKYFLENGMPEFDNVVKEMWTQEEKQDDKIKELIEESFIITGNKNDKVPIREIRDFKKINDDDLKAISINKFNQILETQFGLVRSISGSKRYWRGIKKIDENDKIKFL